MYACALANVLKSLCEHKKYLTKQNALVYASGDHIEHERRPCSCLLRTTYVCVHVVFMSCAPCISCVNVLSFDITRAVA
jgi:hypothetical protein